MFISIQHGELAGTRHVVRQGKTPEMADCKRVYDFIRKPKRYRRKKPFDVKTLESLVKIKLWLRWYVLED